MNKNECLVEVRAFFYTKGEKVSRIDIQECDFPSNGVPLVGCCHAEVMSCVFEHEEKSCLAQSVTGNIFYEEYVVTEDIITYSFSIIPEGVIGEGASAFFEYEVDHIGWDFLMKDFEFDLRRDALVARAKYRQKDGKEARGVCFLIALGVFHRKHPEDDPEIDYLGRVETEICSRSNPFGGYCNDEM